VLVAGKPERADRDDLLASVGEQIARGEDDDVGDEQDQDGTRQAVHGRRVNHRDTEAQRKPTDPFLTTDYTDYTDIDPNHQGRVLVFGSKDKNLELVGD
jgi:hypothetical protein